MQLQSRLDPLASDSDKQVIALATAEDAWRLNGSGPGLHDVPSYLRAATPARFGYAASGGRHINPPHLALLDQYLIRLAFGQIKRLIVMMPPRHGKSQRCSRYFPAWCMGTFPDWQIILAAYGDAFASEWGRAARDVLEEHGQEHFGIRIRQDSRATNRFQVVGREGVMRTAGVGGPITGRGAHLFIIDDPIKNAEEALSPTYRDKTWAWWLSTASTRLEPDGRLLVILTRWHDDDLAGRMLETAKRTGEEWHVLRLPAIAEENDALGRQVGEALWPDRYNVEALEAIRMMQDDPSALMVAHWWEALFQQNPVPRVGGFFSRDWPCFSVFTVNHPTPRIETVRYWDKAAAKSKGSARTASVRMSLDVNGKFIVEHSTALQLGPAEREEYIREVAEADGPGVLQIVEQEGGSAGMDSVEATASNLAGHRFLADRPSGQKEVRAEPFAAQCKANNVLILDGPWRKEYVDEVTSFPFGKRKDLVDASSGGFNYLARRRQKFRAAVGGSRIT